LGEITVFPIWKRLFGEREKVIFVGGKNRFVGRKESLDKKVVIL